MIHAGANDIMLKQDLSKTQMNPFGALVAPQWVYTQPTPLLIQKGLTATVLQEELQIINDKSADWYFHPYITPQYIHIHRLTLYLVNHR